MSFGNFVRSRGKKMLLLFLIGFFSGGILVFICQSSIHEYMVNLEHQFQNWVQKEEATWQRIPAVIWERGKCYLFLWLVGITRYGAAGIVVAILYIGLQVGFLAMYFIILKGWKGILIWLASGLPHGLMLAPLYVYSFYYIGSKRWEKHPGKLIVMIIVFVLACILEAVLNGKLLRLVY